MRLEGWRGNSVRGFLLCHLPHVYLTSHFVIGGDGAIFCGEKCILKNWHPYILLKIFTLTAFKYICRIIFLNFLEAFQNYTFDCSQIKKMSFFQEFLLVDAPPYNFSQLVILEDLTKDAGCHETDWDSLTLVTGTNLTPIYLFYPPLYIFEGWRHQ